ncbi:MAG: hypothetical protein K0R39_52 [Symbiobacteriaceae bacterium]|nr:hypothetical protein [Symbiobacteriaceae bacterium]
MWRTVFFPYVNYVLLFLGMGLISGAIVHMPVDPVKYTAIMLIGAAMFGFASFITEIRGQANLGVRGIVRALAFSLLLSVGIGMMSGGIQHFSDNPAYSATLIPTGFAISLFSFVLKSGVRLSVKRIYGLILACVLVLVPLSAGLNYVVGDAPAATSDGHGHGH